MSVPFNHFLPVAVFIAGLIGSAHCAGMCGPLILALARHRHSLAAYHIGRLLSYSTAGALAGAIGSSLLDQTPLWVRVIALGLPALILITSGVKHLAGSRKLLRFHTQQSRISKSPTRMSAGLNKLRTSALQLRERSPLMSSFSIGLLSVFLPCGHLSTFLAASVATGSGWAGTILMAAFILGTLPALGFGLRFVQMLLSPTKRYRAAGVLLILSGLMSLASFAAQLGFQPDAATTPTHNSSRVNSVSDITSNPARALRCH